MPLVLSLYDTATGKHITGDEVANLTVQFTDEKFTAPGGGQTTFQLAGSISASQKIDVWWNGRLQEEGATEDYQRDDGLNQIIFNFLIPELGKIRVRLHG